MSSQDAGNLSREDKKPYLGLWGMVEMHASITIQHIKAFEVTQQQELQSLHQESWAALQSLLEELKANLEASLREIEK
ncbi:TPA: hypothetical protein ACGUTS_003914 [Vibrio vulnificus]|nr:hypothetical protein [Vibrio vulnificus]